MFNNLVESGSHRRDLARKGRFMLGTLTLYGVLLAASGVASVLAYDARLERQTLELNFMVAPVPVAEAPRPREDEAPPPRARENNARDSVIPERATAIAQLNTSTAPPDTISTKPNPHKELPGGLYRITGRDIDPLGGGPATGPGEGDGRVVRDTAAPVRVIVPNEVEPLPPTPAPTPKPPPQIVRVSTGVITGKVLNKPVPPYPAIARATKTQGPVNVEILIDESGNVISARAVSGPAMLRQAAEQAARQARFSPTRLGGQPVKVSGVITYNFVLN